MLQIYRMLCTTIHNLFKQHFVSWNGLLLNSTYELQIPTEGRGPGAAGISHKNLWLVVPKSAISGHSSPPNAQIGTSNPLFPDQDQAKICLSNPLSPGQGSAGASRGLLCYLFAILPNAIPPGEFELANSHEKLSAHATTGRSSSIRSSPLWCSIVQMLTHIRNSEDIEFVHWLMKLEIGQDDWIIL